MNKEDKRKLIDSAKEDMLFGRYSRAIAELLLVLVEEKVTA